MNILMANSYYYPNSTGGAELICRQLAEKLVERGHSVDVLTIDERKHKEIINGVNVIYLDTYIGKNRNKSGLKYYLACLLRLYDIFDYSYLKKSITKEYDIINTHAIEDITPIIWGICKRKNIKIVHTLHDKYLICPRLFKLTRKNKECKLPRIKCLIRKELYKRLSKNVDCFISPSQSHANSMYMNCTIVRNGVNLCDYDKFHTPNNTDPFRFIYVGNLAPHKGIEVLLEAFNKCEGNYELLVIGDGLLRYKVENAINNDKRISFYGWLDNKKVKDIIRTCNCLVIPSICQENCPTVVLEAFSCGIPVIGSNLGGIPELVDDGVDGFLFEAENVNDLYNKMKKISEADNNEMIRNNIKEKINSIDIEFQAKKYEDIYFDLIK